MRPLDRRMGEALGKLCVSNYFPPDARAKVRAMVDNLLAAFPDVKPGDRYYLPPEKRVRLW